MTDCVAKDRGREGLFSGNQAFPGALIFLLMLVDSPKEKLFCVIRL
jgi:hypothetical protein